jgi:hypothetical protein
MTLGLSRMYVLYRTVSDLHIFVKLTFKLLFERSNCFHEVCSMTFFKNYAILSASSSAMTSDITVCGQERPGSIWILVRI